MEPLLAQQNSLGREIEKLVVNFKKSSLKKRTADFLHRTLTQLEELWQQFIDAINEKIHRIDPPTDLPYMATY